MVRVSTKQLVVYSALFMICAGSLMHFVYAWSGNNPVLGVVSAINESVWEHTKLYILPLFLVGIVEYILLKDSDKILWAKLVEFIFMVVFIIAFFYTYTGALGIEPVLFIDILSFIVAIILGQYIYYRIIMSKAAPLIGKYVSGALLMTIFLAFTYFTFKAPSYPLFEVHDHSVE